MAFIHRIISDAIREAARFYQVIVITGPRQTGKTTLCKELFGDYSYYNFEDLGLRQAVADDPKGFLEGCGKEVILDEIQNIPDLFSYIQLTVDTDSERKFILTGSNNFSLMENITQSLAGRAALYTLLPFSLSELSEAYRDQPTDTLIHNGLFPGVIVKGTPPELFYRNYYSTYVERDVRQIKQITDLPKFQTLMKLVAGRVGSECNSSALANETGVSSPTIKSWLGVMETSYIIFTLPSYHTNISKRLTKTPKVYFTDTGLLCYLLDITTVGQLATHPLRGAIFENMVVVEMLKRRLNQGRGSNLHFYRESSGREVDILQTEADTMKAFEIKSSKTYNRDFQKNLTYLRDMLGDKITEAAVIYDGDSIPPNIYNFRRYPK
ncbi:MAG: ATP-binding protein [Bacteroidales bacterium]|nr:ATP-binding protein [Bacteroidales bacterium]